MNHLRLIHLTSVEELRAAASNWDDLWWRSDVVLPTARAEMLALWVEQFKPRVAFHVLIVADAGRWIAALPLVAGRVGRIFPVGGLPCNAWSPCGDLLLDPTAEVDAALDLLMAAVADLPWQLLWINEAAPESLRWQAFLRVCDRTAISTSYHERYRVGRVEIDQTWDLYQKRLSRTHRQAMNRSLRRLACEGDVQFEMRSHWAVEEIAPWLRSAFELEDQGWKGAAGTSVLHTPGMFQFFIRQAEQLAQWGQLETAAMRLNGRMVAFVSGFRAKSVYFAHKISYDSRLSAFSPGQLLFYYILERLHKDGGAQALDFMGPLTEATSRWRPATYGIGRVVLAPHRLLGRAALYGYKHWWRPFRHQGAAAPLHDHDTPPCCEPSATLETIKTAIDGHESNVQ